MKDNIKELFQGLRNEYLNQFSKETIDNERRKIEEIDNFVLENLKKYHDFYYILNNKLSAYVLFLNEQKKCNFKIDKRIKQKAYERLNKINNTIKILEDIGKETDTKFLLIKSLNILPYFPVNDIDVMINNLTVLNEFDDLSDQFTKSNEEEVGKENFLPLDHTKFFKLSFHLDLTWDGVKIEKMAVKDPWKKSIKISPHVYLNSPKVEATIKFNECVLENLHFKLVDYLYVNYYSINIPNKWTSKKYNFKFPFYIKLLEIFKYTKNRKLFLKNLRRFYIWKFYSKITKKIPLRERSDK